MLFAADDDGVVLLTSQTTFGAARLDAPRPIMALPSRPLGVSPNRSFAVEHAHREHDVRALRQLISPMKIAASRAATAIPSCLRLISPVRHRREDYLRRRRCRQMTLAGERFIDALEAAGLLRASSLFLPSNQLRHYADG